MGDYFLSVKFFRSFRTIHLLSEILFPITFEDEISQTDSMQVYPEWKSNPQKISRTIHLQDRKQAAKHLQSSASRPIDDGNIL